MATEVIYRAWPTGDVIALFPRIYEYPVRGRYIVQSYEHVGQHGAADPSIVNITRLARPEEYAELHAELVSIGYDDLVVRKRFPSRR